MKNRQRFAALLAGALVAAIGSPGAAQVLYMQDFQTDDTANWTVNNGPSDEAHDFFFDYSTVGIPLAPNSAAGPTRGMKLQANVFNGVFGGMSVSPNGQSFEGDYSIKFDWWANYLGPLPTGAAGSTTLSTFGIGTTGTAANWPGAASTDGTYFAITPDGASGSDLRVYSAERNVSYQLPHNTAILDNQVPPQPIDSHATYLGNSRNSNVEPYLTAFPGGKSAPGVQATDPQFTDTQTGLTSPGAAGFTWNEMEIRKVGELVQLFANDIEIMNVDMTHYVTPNAGSNILFGFSDTNAGTNLDDPDFPTLQFTLIDNVKVEAFVEMPDEDADFDNDGDVDGTDFLIFQRGLGPGDNSDGDADGNNMVDGADLAILRANFGDVTPPVSAVPEPGTWALAVFAGLAAIIATLPRRRLAPARVAKTTRQ